MTTLRTSIAALVVVTGIFATRSTKPQNAAGLRRPLREFPSAIGSWRSEDFPFEARVVQVIGADDYINREYFGAAPPIDLYIGYYKDQRSGDAIHSPKNCLPGEGWQPVRSTRLDIGSTDRPAVVNEYLVEQGRKRDLVLYWYQTHERIVASEYGAKFWLVADGLKRRGTDGAMIRIWTTAADGEPKSIARAMDFARHIYPQLAEFLSD
jgi:EpsI family protein